MRRGFSPKGMAGVTLIELMIVIAIVAILAAIAYSGYSSQMRKSRRSDAIVALNTVQQAQEKLRASCPFYGQVLGGAATVCGANAAGSTIEAPTTSENGHYTIVLTAAGPNGYTATATAVGAQASDQVGGTTCTMVLAVSAGNPDGARTPAACWP
jgi:type IV pilus assembly protein PilE